MIYFDGTRITADTFRELFRFCEKKRIPEYLIESVGGMVICHLQVVRYKQIVSHSTGVKNVDADEFNSAALQMSKTDLKNAIQAYHDVKMVKTEQYTRIDEDVPKRAVNGKKYVKVNWRKPTGERDLFLGLWNSRERKCVWCGKYLYEFNVGYFDHIKVKSVYPELRLEPENIRILCLQCHNDRHNKGEKIR